MNTAILMKQEMQDVLEKNILPFWMNKMVDNENGGFYGRIDGSGKLHTDAEKGAILNARILWTFSAAYRVLRKEAYKDMATRAKRYIIDHFIDKEYGGVYWSLDYKGNPLDTKKQFYAIGFAIYGLSEYARATGDHEALDYALQLFECIEEHAFDDCSSLTSITIPESVTSIGRNAFDGCKSLTSILLACLVPTT